MFSALLTAFFRHEKIITTEPKARELKRLADKIVTLGKTGGLAAVRQVAETINDAEVVSRIFKQIAPRFTERKGGYTRLIKVGQRRGDAAEMTIIELVEGAVKAPAVKKPAAKKAPAKKAAKVEEAGEKKPAAKRTRKPKAEAAAPAPAVEAPSGDEKA
jgi:large subunit ribosomal protein L17